MSDYYSFEVRVELIFFQNFVFVQLIFLIEKNMLFMFEIQF